MELEGINSSLERKAFVVEQKKWFNLHYGMYSDVILSNVRVCEQNCS